MCSPEVQGLEERLVDLLKEESSDCFFVLGFEILRVRGPKSKGHYALK